MGIDKFVQEKRGEIVRIAARYGAHDVSIFGSRSRGEARPDSDLDILVRLNPDCSLLDLVAIKQDLEDLLDCHVDVVTEAAVSPYLRQQVLKEAVPL